MSCSGQWKLHQLHHSWNKFLPVSVLQYSPPAEKKADCMNCPKIKSDGFRPDVKCCTYHPIVPNYMLGYAIRESDRSRKKIEELISVRRFTPEGSGHTPIQWMDVMRLDQSKSYGKSSEVICSFVENGGCSIYHHRNSACSTYFCRYDERWGEEFWERMHHYMGRIELALTQFCLRNLDFDLNEYQKQFAVLSKLSPDQVCDPKSKMWTHESSQRLWGKWFGKEQDFFVRCSKLVDEISEPFRTIKNENLVYPNLLEISAMESKLNEGDEQDPVEFEVVEKRLLDFIKRLEK